MGSRGNLSILVVALAVFTALPASAKENKFTSLCRFVLTGQWSEPPAARPVQSALGLGGSDLTTSNNPTATTEDNSLVGQIMNHPQVRKITDLAVEALGDITGSKLEPAEMREIQNVGNVGDRFIAKRSKGLILVRNKALVGRDYEQIELRGEDPVSARTIGEYFVVLTSTPARADQNQPIVYHVNIVKKGETKATAYDSRQPVTKFDLENNQGEVFAVGRNLLFLVNVRDAETGKVTPTLTVSDLQTNSRAIEYVAIGKFNFLKVSHEGGAFFFSGNQFTHPNATVLPVFVEIGSRPTEILAVNENLFLFLQENSDGTTRIVSVSGVPTYVVASSTTAHFKFRPTALKVIRDTDGQVILEVDRLIGPNRYVVVEKNPTHPVYANNVTVFSGLSPISQTANKMIFVETSKTDGKEQSILRVFPDKKIPRPEPKDPKTAPPEPTTAEVQVLFQTDEVAMGEIPRGMSTNPNRIFLKVGVKGERAKIGDATAVLDLRTRQTVVLGEVLKVQPVMIAGKQHYIILSRNVGNSKIGITVYNDAEGTFRSVRVSTLEDKLFGQNVLYPSVMGFDVSPQTLTAQTIHGDSTLLIRGDVQGQPYHNAISIVSVTEDNVSTLNLFNVYEPKIIGKAANETIIVAEQDTTFVSEKSNTSTVVHFGPKTGMTTMGVAAKIGTLDLQGNQIVVAGSRTLLTTTINVDYRWKVGAQAVDYEVVNRRAVPLYEDKEAGFSIQVTDAQNGATQRVLLVKKDGEIKDIKLTYQAVYDEARKVETLFGPSKTHTEKKVYDLDCELPVNEVVREGNLLFITAGDKRAESRTFIYDLNSGKVTVSFPNYQGHRDVENYRFYVGHPSPSADAIVAVFDRATNAYIMHFNFGQVRVDLTREDAIVRDPQKRQIRFRTVTGANRVFDENQNNFLGFLPPEIVGEFKELTQGLGSILNVSLFANDANPVYGRDQVVTELQNAHSLDHAVRKGRPKYVVLKGEDGAGKSSILNEYFTRYMGGNNGLQNVNVKAVFFEIDPMMIAAGGQLRGNVVDKWMELRRVAEALARRGYQLVLVIPKVDTILPDYTYGGIDNEADLFSNLAQLKDKSKMDLIFTASIQGWDSMQRNHQALTAGFTEVLVPPMSSDATIKSVRQYLQERHPGRRVIDDSVIRYTVSAVQRVEQFRVLPGTVFDVIKSAIDETLAQTNCNPCIVTQQTINRKLAGRTGLPPELIDGSPRVIRDYQERIRRHLRTRITGQDAAIDKVVNAIQSFALGINQKNVPIMSFLFAGPTGVGKTAVIEATIEFIFGNKNRLLKIPCQDYGPGIDARKLNELKQVIVKHIRRNGFNGILFDEIEKMDPAGFKLVLDILDGSVTDANGARYSSAMTMFWATTNLGMRDILIQNVARANARQVLLTSEERNGYHKAGIFNTFQPEEINRFDDIVFFNALKESDSYNVVEIYLNDYVIPPLADRDIIVHFDSTAIKALAKAYTDEMFGARRTGRRIKTQFTDSFLATQMMSEVVVPGKHYIVMPVAGSPAEAPQFRMVEEVREPALAGAAR